MRLKAVFTLDYEIWGDGAGSPQQLMVEPTWRLMRLFERYGAKLTIMAEVAEILRFRAYYTETGEDRYDYRAIIDQLRHAIRCGHDVQLHLHPSYFCAEHRDGFWAQHAAEYDLARLSRTRAREVVATSKAFLEDILRPVRPGYRCHAFRAGNWAMMPSHNIVAVLIDSGIDIDTSVFKGGVRAGKVNFDYSHAPSSLVPWPADRADINRCDNASPLWEFPIYCERRPIWDFLTVGRLTGVMISRFRPRAQGDSSGSGAQTLGKGSAIRLPAFRRPWKADFNQCSGRQMIAAMVRARARHAQHAGDLPFVLIGHSKLHSRQNERDLETLLKFIVRNSNSYAFAVFSDFGRVASHDPRMAAE